MIRTKILGISLPLLALAITAHAGTVTFKTATGATETGGQAVNAQAVITTGAGQVGITLSNLLANPNDVAQLLSDFSFTLSGTTSGATLFSSSGQEITIASGGASSLGSTVAAGWILSSPSTGTYLLNDLAGGAAGPAHLIIGPGPYTNANGSIAGNGPHNPFLNGSATFTLNITGVTADTTVSNVVFSFGTTPGDNVPGGSGPNTTIPEPVSLSLVGGGLLALGLLRKRMPR
jgi:hypothetical protein